MTVLPVAFSPGLCRLYWLTIHPNARLRIMNVPVFPLTRWGSVIRIITIIASIRYLGIPTGLLVR